MKIKICGVSNLGDATEISAAGADAALVGTLLMASDSPADELEKLLGAK